MPLIRVTVDVTTLLGLNDNPGELDRHGPIPAALARELAADGEWRRFVTDPMTGHLLDASPGSYRLSARLRAQVSARDLTCRHPGCRTSAARCDIDHVIPFDHGEPGRGGQSVQRNLCAKCRRHHNCKTWYSWQVRTEPDGTLVHRTPLGRVYRTPPVAQPTALF